MHPLLFLENPYFPPHVTYAWFLAIAIGHIIFSGDPPSGNLSRQISKCNGSNYWRT